MTCFNFFQSTRPLCCYCIIAHGPGIDLRGRGGAGAGKSQSRTRSAAQLRRAILCLRLLSCFQRNGVLGAESSEGPRRKDKGTKAYHTWLEANYSKAFYVGESRASGGRQDLEFEASVAAYVDRPHYVKFLEAMLADPQHRNILETSARPRRAFRGKKTSSSSTITSLNPDGSGRTESRFRVPTRAPRDRRSLGARLDDGKIPGFQCRPLPYRGSE